MKQKESAEKSKTMTSRLALFVLLLFDSEEHIWNQDEL